MTPREEELYWRGSNFPGTLSQNEFEEWARIVNAYEKKPTKEEQKSGGNVLITFCILLSLIGVFLWWV